MNKSVTIRAAWIGAIALIIAALIGLVGVFISQNNGVEINSEGNNSSIVVGTENTSTVQQIDKYYDIKGDVTFSSNNEVAGYVKDDIETVHSHKKKKLIFKVWGKEVIPEEGKLYNIEKKERENSPICIRMV